MRFEPEIDTVSIVLVGNFNPAIFTPSWFVRHGLLPESVERDPDPQRVASPGITQFQAEGLSVMVMPERFTVETQQQHRRRVCDLTTRVFGDLLPHTPLTAFGINRQIHFQTRNLGERDSAFRTLAPVEPWGDWGRSLGPDGEHGIMKSLTMSQTAIEGRPSGDRINVTVEPSVHFSPGRRGVFVGVNDHHEVGGAGGSGSGDSPMELLKTCFDSSLAHGETIVDHIMALTETRRS